MTHNAECCCTGCLIAQARVFGSVKVLPSRDGGIAPALDSVLAEIRATMRDRHEKYGPRNIADSPGGPLNGVRVRVHDKLARINNHVDNDVSADFGDDALRDAFIDLAGYALIGLLVVDGEWPVG